MGTHNLCFEQKYEKHQNFLSEIFPFFNIFDRRVFVMAGSSEILVFAYAITALFL